MPAINFQEKFVKPINADKKTHTIRRKRKKPLKKGDTLKAYNGLRAKGCRYIATLKVTKLEDFSIEINKDEITFWKNKKKLTFKQVDDIAKADGFRSSHEFLDFFQKKYGLPFLDAEIIHFERVKE